MDSCYEKILRRIVEYRKLCCVSQKRMSQCLGITQSHYSKMERGKCEIPFRIVNRWNAIGWDVDYFVTGRHFQASDGLFEKYTGMPYEQVYKELMKFIVGSFRSHQTPMDADILRMKHALELLVWNDAKHALFRNARIMQQAAQNEMAEKLGIGVRKYRRLEMGKEKPDLRIMGTMYVLSGYLPALFLDYEAGICKMSQYLWNQLEESQQKKVLYFVDSAKKLVILGKKDRY